MYPLNPCCSQTPQQQGVPLQGPDKLDYPPSLEEPRHRPDQQMQCYTTACTQQARAYRITPSTCIHNKFDASSLLNTGWLLAHAAYMNDCPACSRIDMHVHALTPSLLIYRFACCAMQSAAQNCASQCTPKGAVHTDMQPTSGNTLSNTSGNTLSKLYLQRCTRPEPCTDARQQHATSRIKLGRACTAAAPPIAG